jgi:glycosyltransferase involved in cell wall biosynthesis
MRVLMLTPDAQMIDRRIWQEARTLRQAGHEVVLLAGFECAQEEEYETDGILVRRLRYPGHFALPPRWLRWLPGLRLRQRVQRLLSRLLGRLSPLPPLERFLYFQGLRHPAEVVHVHDLPALHAGLLLARTWRVPLVYDAHELYPFQEVLPPAVRRACFRKEKRLIRQADMILTVNEFLAQALRARYGVAPLVLYNCAEPEPGFDPEQARLHSPLFDRVPGPGPRLLYQGWLAPERNLETLLRALVHVPAPARLAIIGYGDHLRSLQQLAHRLRLAGRVHFLGPIPSRELLPYTAGADLGLIPYLPIDENHRFCSPNKFFEYVAAQVPILAHPLPFFQQMAQRYGVVRCADFTSPPAVGRAIAELLHSGALLQMRQQCRQARQVLTWRVEAAKLLAWYEALAQRAGATAAGAQPILRTVRI